MPVSIGISLEKDGARCGFRGIRSNGEGSGKVGEMEDRFGQEEAFQGLEGRLAGGGPVPRQVLLGEVDERAGDVGVVRDKSAIKISKAKEGAYVLDFGRGRPAGNAVELDGVHG